VSRCLRNLCPVSGAGYLVVVSGLLGSGKTTEAKRLQAERPGIRFFPDASMTGLGANLWDGEPPARVEGLQWDMPLDVLRAGGTAIIEWGTWDRDERERLRAEAAALGARTELLFLDPPADVLWTRIGERSMEDPPMEYADVVAMHEFMQSQRPDEAERAALDEVL
jgi:predicted kinase